MGARIWMLVGAVLFVVGGYFLFHGAQRDDRQDGRDARIAEAVAVTADATRTLGDTVAQQGEEALASEQRIDALETDTAALRERVQAVEDDVHSRETIAAYAFIAADFTVASAAKVAIAESLMTNAAAPASNAEAGLPAAEDLRGQSLRATHVRADGVIELEYDGRSGVDGGIVRLVPDIELALRSGIVNWRCESADYPAITSFMPACSYVAAP